jgi:L-rhamnose mutarotase
LEDTLLAHGVGTYSIYLDPATRDLFAYVEFDSEERWRTRGVYVRVPALVAYMRDLMPSNPDHSRSRHR